MFSVIWYLIDCVYIKDNINYDCFFWSWKICVDVIVFEFILCIMNLNVYDSLSVFLCYNVNFNVIENCNCIGENYVGSCFEVNKFVFVGRMWRIMLIRVKWKCFLVYKGIEWDKNCL